MPREVGCGGGGWAPLHKKIIFVSNFIWVHFDAVFNRRKTRTVTRGLGTQILRSNHAMKLTKNGAKIILKNSSPPPPSMPVMWGVWCICSPHGSC